MRHFFTVFSLILYSTIVFSQNDTVVIGGDFNYPPYSFIDKDGNEAGYDVDVIMAIAKITGLKIKFKFDNWDTTLIELQNGSIDAVSSIVYSSDREKIYDFSFPLHTEYYAIFAKKTTPINDINDLERKKAAILKGDISNDVFYKPMGLYKDYQLVNSFPEAFNLIDSGICDYLIAPYPLGMEIIKERQYKAIEVKGPPIMPSVYCLAVKQGDYELLAWLNQGIEMLNRSGELDKIYKKWVKYKRADDLYENLFRYALIGSLILMLVVIILLLFWYQLKKQVAKKTIEIKNAQAIYQNVFNSVDDGIIIFDEEGVIIEANQKSLNILEYKEKQIIGSHILDIANKENQDKIKRMVNEVRSGKLFFVENLERKQANNVRYLVLKAIKIATGNENLYLVVIQDVSKERMSYLKLQKTKKEADIANKAKSTFLSTISHEIRTPLFAIIGFAKLLGKTELTNAQVDYNNKIELSGNVLLNLVNDILDLTKIEAEKLELNPQVFNIRKMIQEIYTIENLRASEKRLKLTYMVDDKVPEFLIGDSLRISQILLNILNNAVKFTNDGSVSLLVNIENLSQLNDKDTVNIIFSIKDTGIGISSKGQEKLFKPFVQVQDTDKRKYGGTGLGLTISKQLVEMMNGDILLESTFNKGTVFNIIIPLKIYTGSINESEANDTKVEFNEPVSILLVDDNPFNTEILVEELSETGHKVVHADSGIMAIDYLSKDNDFQVVLMDIEMPDMDGFETTKNIRKLNIKQIPIIALSAHNLHSEREKALKAGMVDYLCKPVSITDLNLFIYKHVSKSAIVAKSKGSGINRAEGLAFFENNTEKYNRTLVRFKKYYSSIPEKMETSYKQDVLLLKDYTHNLKSAAKTIGAIKLSYLAKEYDDILRSRPNDFTSEMLTVLIAELESVLLEIKEFF